MNALTVLNALAHAHGMGADDKRSELKRIAGAFLAYAEASKKSPYHTTHDKFLKNFGMTFNAALDRANPNAICGFVLGVITSYMKFGDDLRADIGNEIAVFQDAQITGKLTTVRGGKIGKFYPSQYKDCHAPTAEVMVAFINRMVAGGYTTSDFEDTEMPFELTSKPTGGTPMDEFNPSAIVAQALICARYHINENTYDEEVTKDFVSELVGDFMSDLCEAHGLNAKQRVSANAAFDLLKDDLTSDLSDIDMTEKDNIPASVMSKLSEPTTSTTISAMKLTALDKPTELALDALLAQATGGETKGIRATFDELTTLRDQASKLEGEIEVLKKRKTTVPVTVASADVEIDGDTLTYRVEMKKASDIFRNPKTGRPIKQLDFDIPTLVWTDADGKEVQHPLCPDVDEAYFFRAKHLLRMCTALVTGKNVWAHGHTGTGKTTLVEQFYARIGFPCHRVNLDSALERADLVGQISLASEGGTTVSKFEEGVLPKAMVQPCVLIMDEIDAGRADLLFVVQRATEGKGLLLTEDGGRLIKPHPLFRFCATANSRGQGDEHGIYSGVRPVNGALLDRFKTFIEVDYLKPDEEFKVIEKSHPDVPADTRQHIVDFAKSMRKAFVHGEITVPCSPRAVDAICEMTAFYDGILDTSSNAIEEAIYSAIIDRAPMDNRQRVIEIADKHFASCKFK